jgi:ATP-dependent Lon protease
MLLLQPMMMIRKRVLLPQCLLRLSVGKKRSIALVETHILSRSSPYISIFTIKQDDEAAPEEEAEGVHVDGEGDVFSMGCVARVLQVVRASATEQFTVWRTSGMCYTM